MSINKQKIQDLLKNKIIINPISYCWEWQGYRNKKGYGNQVLIINKNLRKTLLSHRLSYLVFKEMINDGKLLILHNCDNPCCINPDHLRLGTNEDNMKESANKNRICYGERIPSSKLKEKDIIEIRKLTRDGLSTRKIAKIFNINQRTVSHINNNTWRRVVEN